MKVIFDLPGDSVEKIKHFRDLVAPYGEILVEEPGRMCTTFTIEFNSIEDYEGFQAAVQTI
ncbi:hypothetical protein R1T16_05605 [Flavobacterium sp. DG1-102-2]|uniref:hypothetical protein n=1 Tax=Flavobacterium sp. DG1-102-2 TaxID=3081663 RepID=UPI00294A4EC8|nr:hypothetical protein [Flavobacterium sp. DG1-102-2]MDV6167891.1 hypothetical protein [Flavobacterium sp. DG1-102-2]